MFSFGQLPLAKCSFQLASSFLVSFGQMNPANCRCTTPTKRDGVPGHHSAHMLDPEYERVPRDAAALRDLVFRAEDVEAIGAAEEMTAPFGVWPYHTALMLMHPSFEQYLQITWDSLHVFDGGVTMRIVLLLGNWYWRQCRDGSAALSLINERLAAVPRHDDFTHFKRPLLSLETSTDSSKTRPVKMSVNFRCVEYQQLVQQIMYSWPNVM